MLDTFQVNSKPKLNELIHSQVTSLERRHSEREKSLHLLIDALSKGKISGLSPDESSSPQSCSSPVNKNL
jgi:hypothetical protein